MIPKILNDPTKSVWIDQNLNIFLRLKVIPENCRKGRRH